MRTLLAFASTAWIAIPLLLLAPQQKAKAQYVQCHNYGYTVQCTGSNGFSLQQDNYGNPNVNNTRIRYGNGYSRNCQTYNNGWTSQTYCN